MRALALYLAITSVSVSGAAPSPNLSLSWIEDQIDRGEVSLEGLLGRFAPKSLERHLLAYDSDGSLQFASYASPRVVVYSEDADFIMAFNGEPGSKGFNELEIIRFDYGESRFKPALVSFDPKGKAKPTVDATPTRCAGCHQTNFRPNWDPYFHWVGFYGSEDDNENAGSDHRGNQLRSGPEYGHFLKFLKKKEMQKAAKEGRYRFLPPHPAERPNNDFNERLVCLNMKRMAADFARHPLAGRLSSYLYLGRIEVDRFPKEILGLAKRSFAEVKTETEAVLLTARRRRLDRHIRITGAPLQGRVRRLLRSEIDSLDVIYELEQISRWRFVFEEILGLPFKSYSTSRSDDYHLNLGAGIALGTIFSGATRDRETGRLVLSKEPQDVSRGSYREGYYACRRENRD